LPDLHLASIIHCTRAPHCCIPGVVRPGPKRAQTSYFLFVAAERDAVKEANPDAGVTDITKILGARWGQMDDAAKAPYEKQAAADKVRYAEELKTWQAAHPDEVAAMDAQGKRGRATKKKQKNGGPKRATTAYFYFTADMRERVKEENPGLKVTEIAKVIGAKWKALTEEEKQKYNDMADKDKDRYAQEKATWDEDHPDEAKPSPKKRAPKKKAAAAAAAADDSDDDSDDDMSVDGDSDDDSE
jgi:hypothetical protein